MGVLTGAAWVSSAQAQSASSTLSSFRSGYGGAGVSGLESPISPSLVGAASQYTLSDGVNQAGAVGSVFPAQPTTSQTSSGQTSGGAGQSSSGVGQAAASNERAPVVAADSVNQSASLAHTAAAASTSVGAAAGANTSLAEAPAAEIVLNGKLNLDGGQ